MGSKINDSFMGVISWLYCKPTASKPRYKERWVPGPSSIVILRLSERLGRCRVELHYGTVLQTLSLSSFFFRNLGHNSFRKTVPYSAIRNGRR